MAEVVVEVRRETGRELDVQVAEKVMGWRVKWTEVRHHGHSLGWATLWVTKLPVGGWFKCPYFSERIEDAWLVVEHMQRCNWTFQLNRHACDVDREDGWTAWFGVLGNDRAQRAPRTICLAAVQACEQGGSTDGG